MTCMHAPSGRKCNCGNDAIYVRLPGQFAPYPMLLCDECIVRSDGLMEEVKTATYLGEIPLSAYEAGWAIGCTLRQRHEQFVMDVLAQ